MSSSFRLTYCFPLGVAILDNTLLDSFSATSTDPFNRSNNGLNVMCVAVAAGMMVLVAAAVMQLYFRTKSSAAGMDLDEV